MELDFLLSRPDIMSDMAQFMKLSREHTEVSAVADRWARFQQREQDVAAAQDLLQDPDMADMATEEIAAAQAELAAQDLLRLGARAALLKGGHLPGDWVVDVLAVQGGAQSHRLQSQRIATHNGHGTGCTLSSAIAAHLALSLPLQPAVEQARAYILGAIAAGANVTTGRGHGPLNHGYAPVAQRVFQAL